MLITLLEAILLGLAAIHVSLTIAFAGVATPALFRTVRRVNRRKRDGEFPGNVWTALVFSASVLIVVRTVSSRIFSLVKAVLTVAIAVERRLGFVRHSPRYLGLAIWCLAAAAMSCRRLMKRGPRVGRLCMKRVVQGMAIGPVEATAL